MYQASGDGAFGHHRPAADQLRVRGDDPCGPQLNIFSIGFAVSMMSGLFILWLTIGGL